MDGWVSPPLAIRFDMSGPELCIFGKNGLPFVAVPEAIRQRDEALKAQQEFSRHADEALKAQRISASTDEALKAQQEFSASATRL